MRRLRPVPTYQMSLTSDRAASPHSSLSARCYDDASLFLSARPSRVETCSGRSDKISTLRLPLRLTTHTLLVRSPPCHLVEAIFFPLTILSLFHSVSPARQRLPPRESLQQYPTTVEGRAVSWNVHLFSRKKKRYLSGSCLYCSIEQGLSLIFMLDLEAWLTSFLMTRQSVSSFAWRVRSIGQCGSKGVSRSA